MTKGGSTARIHHDFDSDTRLLLDYDYELGDMFPADPHEQDELESSQGNWGPPWEYWYYKSVVVFRPIAEK